MSHFSLEHAKKEFAISILRLKGYESYFYYWNMNIFWIPVTSTRHIGTIATPFQPQKSFASTHHFNNPSLWHMIPKKKLVFSTRDFVKNSSLRHVQKSILKAWGVEKADIWTCRNDGFLEVLKWQIFVKLTFGSEAFFGGKGKSVALVSEWRECVVMTHIFLTN